MSLFGEIIENAVNLNDAGEMAERWWRALEIKFPPIEIDEFVVMPNHFHGIISIVGADPCVCPGDGKTVSSGEQGAHVDAPLPQIIQWFKTMTTNEYIRGVRQLGWPTFSGKLWQRGYYEHVIRDERELENTQQYVLENPMRWQEDPDNNHDKEIPSP